jgi:hypothetical protein
MFLAHLFNTNWIVDVESLMTCEDLVQENTRCYQYSCLLTFVASLK